MIQRTEDRIYILIVGLFVGISLLLGGGASEPQEEIVIYFERQEPIEQHFEPYRETEPEEDREDEVVDILPITCDSVHHEDFFDVAHAAYSAGFPWYELHTAVAVAYAESSGDTSAVNHNNNGTRDTGIWQINSVHGFSDLKDLQKNAEAAFYVWELQGWTAWYAHTPLGAEYGSGERFLEWLDESACSIDVYLSYVVQ